MTILKGHDFHRLTLQLETMLENERIKNLKQLISLKNVEHKRKTCIMLVFLTFIYKKNYIFEYKVVDFSLLTCFFFLFVFSFSL